jgi:hypothetical protein
MSDPALLALVVLVAALLVLGVGMLLLAARRARTGDVPPGAASPLALGVAGGLLFGGLLGTIVWTSTGEFVFWVIFVGGGLTLGIGTGSAWSSRHHGPPA